MRCKGIMFAAKAVVVAGSLIVVVLRAAGADQSWTATSSPFWTDAGNWGSGVAPRPGDNLLFTLNSQWAIGTSNS